MPKCPTCGTAGAYIGFSSIECPNRTCEHFKEQPVKMICYCCGQEGHDPSDCPEQKPGQDNNESDGPPSMYSAGHYSSPPPDWAGD